MGGVQLACSPGHTRRGWASSAVRPLIVLRDPTSEPALNRLLPLMLVACGGTCQPGDTGSPTDSLETSPADTQDSDQGVDDAPVSDVSWWVNETIGSVVHVSWQQEVSATAWLEFSTDGETWQRSPQLVREVGEHEALILGVPYGSTFTFRVASDQGEGTVYAEDQSASNDPLPEEAPVPALTTADQSGWAESDRWLLIGMSNEGENWEAEAFWKLILNRDGEVVWAHETPGGYRSFYMQPSRDGSHIIWDETTFWTDFDKGAGSQVHRMTLDGAILESIALPGLHHTFIDLGEGHLVWGGVEEREEVIRERDADGDVRPVWNCDAFWTAHGASRGCDGNAMFFNEPDNTLLFSSDNDNTVVELDRETGEVLRYFGQLDGAWAFSEGSNAFWKQHSPTYTEEGNLLLSTWAAENRQEVVAREYALDEENQQLVEVWSCGEGTGDIGRYAGEAHRLAGGNTLLNYGDGGIIREYTPGCEVVWHLVWPGGPLLGRAMFLDDLYDYAP